MKRRKRLVKVLGVITGFVILNLIVFQGGVYSSTECCCEDIECRWVCHLWPADETKIVRVESPPCVDWEDTCSNSSLGVRQICVRHGTPHVPMDYYCTLEDYSGTGCKSVGGDGGNGNECLISNLLGEDNSQLDILRQYRYNVLEETPEGKELIKLYYQWSPAIVKAMEEDEEFKEEVKELIDGILPMLREVVE